MLHKVLDSGPWSGSGGHCQSCGGSWLTVSFGRLRCCPYCGSANIIIGRGVSVLVKEDAYAEEPEPQRTPEEIVEEIEHLYHEEHDALLASDREERMKELLHELKLMAEERRVHEEG